MIAYGRQSISPEDIQAVVEVLQSDYLTQGPVVPAFEQAVARRCQASYGVAVNSATSALHLACLALGVGPGDRVWTSAMSFVASANCARYCGAEVDFVDIESDTGLMDVDLLCKKLVLAADSNALPTLVIAVHLAGQACDMAAIGELARQYGFAVVEDASHAIGGCYRENPIGDCRYSDIAVLSFHPVKIITTGEGGMALTNNAVLAERMQLLRSHGITRDESRMNEPSHGPWYYQQLELGYNYRMTDLQAALGLSQLDRLETFVARRRQLADRYDEMLAGLPLRPLARREYASSAWHLYIIQLEDASSHRGVFEQLRARGIGVNLHYIPIPAQPYYRRLGFDPQGWPAAMDYYQRAISLPLHPGLSDEQQQQVVAILTEVLT